MKTVYHKMVCYVLTNLMKCFEPFVFQYLKHHLVSFSIDGSADIVWYTLYRCRPGTLDGSHESFRNEKRFLSFQDVVIAIYADSVDALRDHLERRCRCLYGGSLWT